MAESEKKRDKRSRKKNIKSTASSSEKEAPPEKSPFHIIPGDHSRENLEEAPEELKMRLEELTAEFAESNAALQEEIAERRKVEEALRETERDLNRAQAVSQTGSWQMDVQEDRLLWSDETYHIFGIPAGIPMNYESFLYCVHPDDREYVDRRWNAALQGEDYDIEHRIIAGNEVKWVREKAELEFDLQGMLKGGFGTVQDITEDKKTEEQIAFQSELLNTIEDCILVADTGRRIAYWGRGAASLLGWQPEDVMRMDVANLLFPEKSSREVEAVEKMMITGRSWSGELTVRHRDGTLVPLLVRSSPVLDKDGNLIGVVAVGKDITELKKVEQMKDEFIGLVSHELRTPLTIITGSLQTAVSPDISPEAMKELLQNAAEGADLLEAILQNMLELSRHQAGRLHLSMLPVNIAAHNAANLKQPGNRI